MVRAAGSLIAPFSVQRGVVVCGCIFIFVFISRFQMETIKIECIWNSWNNPKSINSQDNWLCIVIKLIIAPANGFYAICVCKCKSHRTAWTPIVVALVKAVHFRFTSDSIPIDEVFDYRHKSTIPTTNDEGESYEFRSFQQTLHAKQKLFCPTAMFSVQWISQIERFKDETMKCLSHEEEEEDWRQCNNRTVAVDVVRQSPQTGFHMHINVYIDIDGWI